MEIGTQGGKCVIWEVAGCEVAMGWGFVLVGCEVAMGWGFVLVGCEVAVLRGFVLVGCGVLLGRRSPRRSRAAAWISGGA